MSERALSFWGWGYADRFPAEAERRSLARLVSAVLGNAHFEVREPPALADLSLPGPRVAVPGVLAGFCSAAPGERAAHTYGKSYRDLVRGFTGDFAVAPDFVARPRDEDEVRAVLDWCADRRVACIPFGGGTSVVGGVEGRVGEGFAGVVSLDVRALDRVIEVDHVSRAARIQAGATGPGLESQLAGQGVTLRHFPQSFEFSTLGGWIATRAGGHFATLYTHIDDLVESVRMVTPRGVWESLRVPGSGAGPSPDRLVLGSEGILGVITEAWLRVQHRPRWRSSASVMFRDFAGAVLATRDIAQSGLYPANCRLLDAAEAMIHQVAADGSHVLLLGFESADHPVSASMARALEIARAHGGRSGEPVERDEAPDREGREDREDREARGGARATEAEAWRRAFLDTPYRFSALVSIGAVADTFETACTWRDFDALHHAVKGSVQDAMKRTCGAGLIACRFTHVYPDGPAPYYTFIAPGMRADAPDRDAANRLAVWHEIKAAASEAILGHGGTITHHHAVGRVHRPWYDRQRPEPFALALRAAKAALDPAGVLNPGVLVDAMEPMGPVGPTGE
jgi:alkyldihydroxyacetonephosphate synthase